MRRDIPPIEETWPPEEIEREWDDTDDGFFEQLYGSSIGPDPKTQTWETEEGEAGGYDTETKTWTTEERKTYRSWSPEAGAWKTKKEYSTIRPDSAPIQPSRQEDFALLAGLLSVVIEKLDQISAKMDTPQQTIQTKKTEPKDFASFIRHKESIDKILELLHSWIDNSGKVKALVYLKAAIDANVITRPTYDAAKAEFPGRLGSKSLYYFYTGEPLAFTDKDDLETLKQSIALLQKFKE